MAVVQALAPHKYDQQGLRKLDLDAHELARQSLDMGTQEVCSILMGSTTTFTASPVSSIAESVKLPVVRGRISWAIAKRSLSPTAS